MENKQETIQAKEITNQAKDYNKFADIYGKVQIIQAKELTKQVMIAEKCKLSIAQVNANADQDGIRGYFYIDLMITIFLTYNFISAQSDIDILAETDCTSHRFCSSSLTLFCLPCQQSSSLSMKKAPFSYHSISQDGGHVVTALL
jgi:hypothetical protein